MTENTYGMTAFTNAQREMRSAFLGGFAGQLKTIKDEEFGKVTFYKYFFNKDELVKSIRDELIYQGFKKYDEINELDLSFPEKVGLITQWRIDFFSNINSEFIEDILSVDDTIEEMKQSYMENIAAAQLKGKVRIYRLS